MGEGGGEGEYSAISCTYVSLPFIPSRQGRGNPTFHETVKRELSKKLTNYFSGGHKTQYVDYIDYHLQRSF